MSYRIKILSIKKILLLLVTLTNLYSVSAQAGPPFAYIIKGSVSDSLTQEKLVFATVYNHTTGVATITNYEGYFELSIQSAQDSVFISYIGYKTKLIPLLLEVKDYNFKMERNTFQLKTVSIKPKDYSYLYHLILACKEKRAKKARKTKAYYQLKSYIDGEQIELVESFYNSLIRGYNVLNLKFKAGRLGLRKYDQSIFASLESSKPIKFHKMFSSTTLFPYNPLEFGIKKMKKKYFLELKEEYLNEDQDSIYVVYFFPKKDVRLHFSCKVWINATDTSILKVELSGENLTDYPLVPLYQKDRLSNKNLTITKTFQKIDKEVLFEHIDFEYDFQYNRKDGSSYKVNSKAVLFAYDIDNQFKLPKYELSSFNLTDYQKFSIIPYNDFFWKYNNELRLNYPLDSNQIFIENSETINNESFDQYNTLLSTLFNYETHEWSKSRIAFEELPKNTPYVSGEADYKLAGKLFLDYNTYQDSVNIVTKSIFDVYQSYYRLYIDNTTNCFFNMYFDLIEIERRKLEKRINDSNKSWETVNRLYSESKVSLSETIYFFLEDVGMGRNRLNMESWNDRIRDQLQLDNLSIFKIYEE